MYWKKFKEFLINPPTTDPLTNQPTDPKFTDPLARFCLSNLITKKYLLHRMQTQLGKCENILWSI